MKRVKHLYFPKGTFSHGAAELDDFTQDWYGGHLRSMHEPRLFLTTGAATIYRFLCLPTFDAPSVIRINKVADQVHVTSKKTRGLGGYGPGKLVRNERSRLSVHQWQTFESAVKESFFWSLPTIQRSSGLDGTQCVIEGYTDEHYHVVDRWSPHSSTFRKLCNRFIELCPFDVVI